MSDDNGTCGKIRALLADYEAEARNQGLDPDTVWEPTKFDLEWVCDQLGRKPSREEWAGAGLPHVGSARVADEGKNHLPCGCSEADALHGMGHWDSCPTRRKGHRW